ncbi:MAG: AAA family ATPase [Xanthomonadales bacterium]|nr:AAA family ATPase [Xanthomonadales bacterium]
MLKTLHIQNFTAFKNATFEFSEGLNVVIGVNGTGKTHLLKLAYLFGRAWPDLQAKKLQVTKPRAETYLGERLAGMFRVTDLGQLIRQGHKNGAKIEAHISGHIPTIHVRTPDEPELKSPGLPEVMPWKVEIKRQGDADSLKASLLPEIVPDRAASNAFLPRQVFVPSKEMVSLFKGLIGLFETYRNFPLDETYRDLAVAMSTLEPRQLSSWALDLTKDIQTLLAGQLRLENEDLVFVRDDGFILISQLLAEGHRKLAMLVYLLRNGIVERGSTLFWDEPEANLNPAAIRLLAEAFYKLSGQGVQIVLATHSLFLLRELEILKMADAGKSGLAPRYFGLGLKRGEVVVTQGDDIADIEPLVALDENLKQSDRYLEAEHAVSD